LVLVVNVDQPGLDRSWIANDVLLVYDIVLRLFVLVSRSGSKLYGNLTDNEIQRWVSTLVGAFRRRGCCCHFGQQYPWHPLILRVSTVGVNSLVDEKIGLCCSLSIRFAGLPRSIDWAKLKVTRPWRPRMPTCDDPSSSKCSTLKLLPFVPFLQRCKFDDYLSQSNFSISSSSPNIPTPTIAGIGCLQRWH